MPKLILMVGESGSGKSTRAHEILAAGLANGQKIVRVNMDNIREMLFGKNSSWDLRLKKHNQGLVSRLEENAVMMALGSGFDAIVDDINLSTKAQNKWKSLMEHYKEYKPIDTPCELEIVRMDTPFEECVRRDALRTGKEHVGRAVIENQFIRSGRANFGTKPIILCDVDGTLANSDGVRSPYDESKVGLDRPYSVVIEWVRALSLDHSIVIVSGRHATCSDATVDWLRVKGVPFDHILMRNGGDNRDDRIVKKEFLDGMLKCGVTKEQIKFVLDDRPKVIRMWKENGLTVYPVRGAVEEF